jgi:hypothetical protein
VEVWNILLAGAGKNNQFVGILVLLHHKTFQVAFGETQEHCRTVAVSDHKRFLCCMCKFGFDPEKVANKLEEEGKKV